MKTFYELTAEQQKEAVEIMTNELLTYIVNGTIVFNDDLNAETLQSRIDTAFDKAEQMQTPWFAAEYVMETCSEDIEGMARYEAENAVYNNGDTRVVTLRTA